MTKKYKWKCRLLLLKTPDYKNKEYLRSKNIYQDNIKDFHKRYVKLLTKLFPKNKFEIDLVGFDGSKIISFKSINKKKYLK